MLLGANVPWIVLPTIFFECIILLIVFIHSVFVHCCGVQISHVIRLYCLRRKRRGFECISFIDCNYCESNSEDLLINLFYLLSYILCIENATGEIQRKTGSTWSRRH